MGNSLQCLSPKRSHNVKKRSEAAAFLTKYCSLCEDETDARRYVCGQLMKKSVKKKKNQQYVNVWKAIRAKNQVLKRQSGFKKRPYRLIGFDVDVKVQLSQRVYFIPSFVSL